jgi:hypothetical protein
MSNLSIRPAILKAMLLFCLVVLGGASFGQHLSYYEKKKYFDSCNRAIEDSLHKLTSVKHPFVVGVLHEPETNRFRFPYYQANIWVDGSIVYNDKQYVVNNLKYDVANDKLVFLWAPSEQAMHCVSLDENFITEFSILSKTFRYLKDFGGGDGKKMDVGYYEIVYDGNMKFLVRTTKERFFDSEWPHFNYKESVSMFLIKNGIVSQVKNMADLKKQLGDKKAEINSFIRQNQISLKPTDYSSVPKILSCYENQSQ